MLHILIYVVQTTIYNGKNERDHSKIAEHFNNYLKLLTIGIMKGNVTVQKTETNIFDSFKILQFRELKTTLNNLKNKKSSIDGTNIKIKLFKVNGYNFTTS